MKRTPKEPTGRRAQRLAEKTREPLPLFASVRDPDELDELEDHDPKAPTEGERATGCTYTGRARRGRCPNEATTKHPVTNAPICERCWQAVMA